MAANSEEEVRADDGRACRHSRPVRESRVQAVDSRWSSCKTRSVRVAPRGAEPARDFLRHREPRVRVGAHRRGSGMHRRRHRRVGARLGPKSGASRACPRPRAHAKLFNDDVQRRHGARRHRRRFQLLLLLLQGSRGDARLLQARARRASPRRSKPSLDAFGGPEASDLQKEKTKLDGFTYVWDQAEFEPVTSRIVCHIHFKFPDGSKIKRVHYDWRLGRCLSRELLLEAGFAKVRVYWEARTAMAGGTASSRSTRTGEADLAWIAYPSPKVTSLGRALKNASPFATMRWRPSHGEPTSMAITPPAPPAHSRRKAWVGISRLRFCSPTWWAARKLYEQLGDAKARQMRGPLASISAARRTEANSGTVIKTMGDEVSRRSRRPTTR